MQSIEQNESGVKLLACVCETTLFVKFSITEKAVEFELFDLVISDHMSSGCTFVTYENFNLFRLLFEPK